MKRILILLLILAMMASLSISAYALPSDSDEDDFSLTIDYSYSDGTVVEGAVLQLYKIASVDDEFQIIIEQEFASFEKDLKDKDTKWDVFANSLAEFISENNIPCEDQTVTDDSGKGYFPTEDHALTPGVYLILSPRYRFNGSIYAPSPVLITLPNTDPSGDLIKHITVKMKFSSTPDKPFDIIVEKKWNDPGRENKRPKDITIQLVKDGQIVKDQDIILNAKNNWSGKWTGLDPIHKWSVKEVEIPNYIVTYRTDDKDGKVYFTILNTYDPDPSEKLPQTGQLNWPIAWMAVTGMALLIFGWQLCKDGRKDLNET